MFTGIVEEKGEVISFEEASQSWRLKVAAKIVGTDAQLGDSIAVNGCCLTVVEKDETSLTFDLLEETRRLTNLSDVAPGAVVNLERSLRFEGRVGGHFLTGHVDGLGQIIAIGQEGKDVKLVVKCPSELMPYLSRKGCVGLDGISLTIAEVEANLLTVWIIPHTLEVTNLGNRSSGDSINVEIDLLARYTERILAERSSDAA